MQYTFIPGDDIPAESFQTIDPDNPVAQSPAQLIGGNDVVLQNFIDLGLGDNNGKFTANIDGVEYEDLGIDLSEPTTSPATEKITQTTSNDQLGTGSGYGQSFNSIEMVQITAIAIYTKLSGANWYDFTLSLREGVGLAGNVISSKQVSAGGLISSGGYEVVFTFDTPILVDPNSDYTFTLTGNSANQTIRYNTTSVYANGHCWLSGTEYTERDLYFKVFGIGLRVEDEGEAYIATLLQAVIRTATSKLETVVYSTDHFEITSAKLGKTTSSILKLQPPTTGTDISGAGYLDLGANATEIAGDGDDYKLVRLDKDGKLLDGLNNVGANQVISDRALNTVYQNTSARTKIVLVSTYNLGYNSGDRSDSKAYIGTTSTPNILVGEHSDGSLNGSHGQLFLIVPPNYYYTITATKSSSSTLPSLTSWFECDLI